MHSKHLALLLAISTAAALPPSSPAQEPAPSPAASAAPASTGEFTLKIGPMEFDVSLNTEFKVPLKEGEVVTASLTRKTSRKYAGHGLKLEYSTDFKLTEETDGELVTITLDHAKSPMVMLQLFPKEVKPDSVPNELLEGIKKEFASKNAKETKPAAAVERDINGTKASGKSIEYEIGGQRIQVEVYAWLSGDRTLALTQQWAADETDLAKELFNQLAGTLEVAK